MNDITLTRILILILIMMIGSEVKATIQQPKINTHKITDNLSVSVYVPDSDIQKSFPTLYLMDGQYYLHTSIGIQHSLNHRNKTIPKFIVVAIDTSSLPEPSELRHQLLNSRSNEMIRILLTKIVPLVDSAYPTSDIKIYFGWEHAAGFGLDLINFSKFNGLLLASAPNISKSRIDNFQKSFSGEKKIARKLYMSLGQRELNRINEHVLIADIVEKQNVEYFGLKISLSKIYGHFTTPIDALTNGLIWFFSDFNEINFYSLEEIIEFGGVNSVKNYYEMRAKKYQISYEIPENTKFTMARHAVKSDNKQLLDEIIEQLGWFDTGGNYWGYYFANFAFKKNDYALAKQFITSSTSSDKPSYRLLTLRGDIESRAHRLKAARDFYGQALKATNDQHVKSIIHNKIKALDNL